LSRAEVTLIGSGARGKEFRGGDKPPETVVATLVAKLIPAESCIRTSGRMLIVVTPVVVLVARRKAYTHRLRSES